MSRRGWIAVVLACALVGVTGVACAVGGSPGDYGDTLVKYGESGEPNRYVDLDDGEAQLSIGSPDGHRIVVQWRDRDGHGWTEPETVWEDRKAIAVDSTVRYGGGTVAIAETYTTDVHSDSDADAIEVGIVCRELRCTAKQASGIGGEPQVTPDGHAAYLGQDEKGTYLWSAAKGIHRASWSGHPGFRYRVSSPSEPVLAPDGSLRVVGSKPSRGHCTFDLLASTPGTADLTSVARTTERLRGRDRSDCRSYLLTWSADWVETHPDDHGARDFWFVRDGDTWTTTHEAQSRLRQVDVAKGCCNTAVLGFVHWNDVAFGSPDGRRILVQHHLLGEETWSEPRLLDGATAGFRCTWMDGYEVGPHGLAVLMVCHSGPSKNQFRGDAYAVAVSTDLQHWTSRFVTGVRREPQVDRDRVRVGDTTWTPDGGFVAD